MDGPSTTTQLAPDAPADAPVNDAAAPSKSRPREEPPAHLPTDPRAFYRAARPVDSLPLIAQPEPRHVLEQLGPPPFRKTSFPLMGFLASLYEHIAAHVARRS